MTSDNAVGSTAYYHTRRLPRPAGELMPHTAQELCDAVDELHSAGQLWRVLGDGQHARRGESSLDEKWTAIRTDELDSVVELDRKSGLVCVEAGMRWKALQAELLARGFSTQRYGLHPSTATVGGMLARRRPGPPMLRGGELLDGCVSIGAHSPTDGEYRYLVAPRKASGPDLRHRFMGAGDADGVIVDATFVVWRPVAERLLLFRNRSLAEAAQIMGELFLAEISPSCVHYSHNSGSLQIILSAPGQLLRSRIRWITEHIGAPDDTGDADKASTRRAWLEDRHPDRRSHPEAARTHVYWMAPSALDADPVELFGNGFDDLEIACWTPRRVEIFARFDESATPAAPPPGACWAHWPQLED